MDNMEAAEYGDELDSGWPTFAGIVTALLGVFNIVEGLLTLFSKRYTSIYSNWFFFFNATGWGWLHFMVGLAILGVGVALLMRMDWAPPAAVGLAAATAIFQMIYVNIIPIWSVITVGLALLIIYALVVKGRDALSMLPVYRAAPVTPPSEPDEVDRP